MEKTFQFDALPTRAQDISVSTDAFETAAQTVVALCHYKNNIQDTIDMLNVLKGPSPVSEYEKQFLHDRLASKEYKPFSFLKGATPENNYTPTNPYTIVVSDNPYSYTNANYMTLFVKSSGADSPREIKLRKKPSTGQWFLVEQMILSDIRIPVSEDEWA